MIIQDRAMDNLELEYLYCCNMGYQVYLFKCALWRIHSDNADRSIMDMITTCEGLQDYCANRANEIRAMLLALGWS